MGIFTYLESPLYEVSFKSGDFKRKISKERDRESPRGSIILTSELLTTLIPTLLIFHGPNVTVMADRPGDTHTKYS